MQFVHSALHTAPLRLRGHSVDQRDTVDTIDLWVVTIGSPVGLTIMVTSGDPFYVAPSVHHEVVTIGVTIMVTIWSPYGHH